jgi:hypothetical protein
MIDYEVTSGLEVYGNLLRSSALLSAAADDGEDRSLPPSSGPRQAGTTPPSVSFRTVIRSEGSEVEMAVAL